MTLYFTHHEYIDYNKVRIFGYEEIDYIIFKKKKNVNYIGIFEKTGTFNDWDFKDKEKDIKYMSYLYFNLDVYSFKIDSELRYKNVKKIIRKKKLEKLNDI